MDRVMHRKMPLIGEEVALDVSEQTGEKGKADTSFKWG